MPGFEEADAAPFGDNGYLAPVRELSQARYRREANAWMREARSKASELREIGRMAATMLQAHDIEPHQIIDQAEAGEGAAWLATRIKTAETGVPPDSYSEYWLCAGHIATNRVKGLLRVDESTSESSGIADLESAVTPITFEEESLDFYWTPYGTPAAEPTITVPTSIRHIPVIRAGIDDLLRQAGII